MWCEDPTYFGSIEVRPVHVETMIASGEARYWLYVRTASDGGFRIDGLLDRAYRLRALDPKSLVAASIPPVDAGARGVEIRLPRSALYPRVHGHVLTRDGEPVREASISVARLGFLVERPGGGTSSEWVALPSVRTDASGAFEILNVAREGIELSVHADAIMRHSVELKDGMDVEDLKIVVSRRMHVQVELDPPIDRADELQVLDGGGKPMTLRIMRDDSSFSGFKFEIENGRSQVISVAEDARTLVLSKNGNEVARIPVRLRAGELNVLRY